MQELKDLNRMHTVWRFHEECDEKVLTDLAEIHIIEMGKAKYEYEKDHNNLLAKWILFILDPNMQEVKGIMSENEEIKKTAQKLESLNDDENIRKRAEILERWRLEEQWNRASLEKYNREMLEKQLKEGLEKMGAELKERIRAEEKERIRAEEEERIEIEVKKKVKLEERAQIAKKMLENSFDVGTISKITGLSKNEIDDLKV